MGILEKSLENKVILITGGTRGIGFATVEKFLACGCKVALLGSRKETVDQALSKLSMYTDVLGFYPDLSNKDAIKETVDHIINVWGKIDVLINNAGVSNATPLLSYGDDEFEKVMNLNVNSIFNMTKAVVPYMKEQGQGVILNTSSMVSIYGQRSGVAYPASKFAVNGLTKSLARELGMFNIRVNAIAPGVTATDMVSALDDKIVNQLKMMIPLNRLGQAEEVANTFLFLASDLASYINGAVVSVDGGCVS